MQPVIAISRIATLVARQVAIQTPSLGVGIPLAVCVAAVLAHLLLGGSPLEFAYGFFFDVAPPLSQSLSILLGVGAVFAIIGGFGHWCLSLSRTTAPALLRGALRLALLAASVWKAAADGSARVRFTNVRDFPPISFPNRVTLLTPAGLSGAAPLLN